MEKKKPITQTENSGIADNVLKFKLISIVSKKKNLKLIPPVFVDKRENPGYVCICGRRKRAKTELFENASYVITKTE